MTTITALEFITLNGEALDLPPACKTCGVEEGHDFYGEYRVPGEYPYRARIMDGLCQYCWDYDQVTKGNLTPCAVGYSGHYKGCGCP